ncbi:MAG: endonuclease/exonuclease/phosphatase family protein [Polyangiaceae bacterium]
MRHATRAALLLLLTGTACSSSRRSELAPPTGNAAPAPTATAPSDDVVDVATLMGNDNEVADYLVLPVLEPCSGEVQVGAALRLATWNMKAARDAPIERVAQEIAAMDVDLIALQEVDVSARRTGELDQPRLLGESLGYAYTFAAALYWDGGVYGLAVLSRVPFVSVERHRLDDVASSEPRIALDVTVCRAGLPVRVIGVHADVEPSAAARQVTLAAELALGDASAHVALVGDFNQAPFEPGPTAASEGGLVDLFAGDERPTAFGRRIDYVFASAGLARDFTRAELWQTSVSDHHALLVDFTLAPP